MGDSSVPPRGSYDLPLSSKTLSSGWFFRQMDGEPSETSWMPVKGVPSTVHQDLIDNKRLPNPFVGFNELKAEWVGEKSWVYKTKFTLPRSVFNGTRTRAILAFDGLDTFAAVRVDGHKVLDASNMFLPYRVDITSLVSTAEPDKEHELEIIFESALLKAREIKANYPEHKWIVFNGDPARLAVRKAQYHWGWDWGPFLMCAGIWREARIEVYEVRIADLRIDVEFGKTLDDVTVHVSIETEGMNDNRSQEGFALRVDMVEHHSEKRVHCSMIQNVSTTRTQLKLTLKKPKLWWPNGYGKQELHDIEVSLYSDSYGILSTVKKRIGLRKVELSQVFDKHGKSFIFRINEVDIFCGGSCWIPADSFVTNIPPEKYRAWIELMVPANQKMIRVWGGGIYEDDSFYDACDELGILVWQDFMFACGNYPTYPSLLESIKAEAIANLRRLRHHPCLGILAGNNEDYQVQEQSGLTYDYADKDVEHWLKTDFPARYIYEDLLPKVVALECPLIPYHPGSPWSDGKMTSDPTRGDLHQWNVWHGDQKKYQIFDSIGGRFNSEFGMEAFPDIETIKTFVENDEDLYPQSHAIDFHNKADGHERRIATYMVENVRTVSDLEGYIYLTQLIQCEALTYGYRGWRRQWGDDRKCGGALVWQLNDCWPVTSWSICDYYLRRKPAYYAMSRILAPITVGVRREHYDWSVSHARQPRTQAWELWAVSFVAGADTAADVEIRFVSVTTGKDIKEPLRLRNVKIQSNGTTEIARGSVDNDLEEPHVLAARIWVDGRIVGRDADWPQPLKYLQFPSREPSVTFGEGVIYISAKRPVKCLVFEEREGCQLSDSAIDVIPGDDQVVTISGVKSGDRPLKWTYLGANEQ